MNKKTILTELHDYAIILVGVYICAAGWVIFLLPNHIMTGPSNSRTALLHQDHLWGADILLCHTDTTWINR